MGIDGGLDADNVTTCKSKAVLSSSSLVALKSISVLSFRKDNEPAQYINDDVDSDRDDDDSDDHHNLHEDNDNSNDNKDE